MFAAYIIPIDGSGLPPHVSGGPIIPGPGGPHIDNSLPWAPAHPGNKPPGRPILPPHPDNGLPPGGGTEPPHIWGGGHWEPVDPGFGLPPLWAFFPADPGFGINVPPPHISGGPIHPAPPPMVGGGPATPPGVIGGGPVTPPVINGGPIHLPGGIWVPTDPDYGKPGCPSGGGKPHPPLWGFIPKPPDFGKPVPVPEPKGGA